MAEFEVGIREIGTITIVAAHCFRQLSVEGRFGDFPACSRSDEITKGNHFTVCLTHVVGNNASMKYWRKRCTAFTGNVVEIPG
jgi:hypothetical protein